MVEAARLVPPLASSNEDIRAHELEFLSTCFAADHGSVVIIHGRRGVGKGRLVEELVKATSLLPKTAIFEGRTPPAGGRSFHPFAEIAHQAMAWAETAGATEAVIDPVYRDLEAVLERSTGEGEASPSLDQKLRFFDSFRRLLSSISERVRLLVVAHDLERADNDTLELASYLSDELFGDPALDSSRSRPGLFVLTLRDDGPESPRARELLAEGLESRTTKRLHLEGLDLEGLRRYVQSPRVLEKLLAASKGLPQELDALIDSLPTNVEELFERRLTALDVVSRTTLQALALLGRPAAARVLGEVVGHPVKAIAQALGDLRDAHVLERRIHRGEFQFCFARRSDLEVTARSTTADDRARLHSGWAVALVHEPDSGGPSLLAHHQLRSLEPARGVPLAIQAAETHAVAGAFDAAVQMLEEARPQAAGELLSTILARLAELAPLTGSPRAALRYVEEWKAALPPLQVGRALHREAELHNAAGDYDRALAAVEEARAATLEMALVERAAIEATASEAYYHLGALQDATRCGEAGLRLLGPLGGEAPARAQIELLNLLGKTALAAEKPDRAIELFQDTRELAESCGLRREQARALVNIGFAHMRLGNTRDAEAHLISGIELAKESNDPTHLAFGQMNLGVLLHQKGELGRAIECYRECKPLFRRVGNRTQLARVLHNLANVYFLCSDLARARAHNDESLRLARASGVERLVAVATALDGLIVSELGDRATGEARLREAMVVSKRLGAQRPLETMLELAGLQLKFDDLARADETLREVEGSLGSADSGALGARALLVRGRLLAALEDPTALGVLTDARDRFAGLGRMLFLRDAELAIGKALEQVGQRETARMHLTAAVEIQRDIGAELPEDLRAQFLAARPQQEAVIAIRGLDETAAPRRSSVAQIPAPERSAGASRARSEPREPSRAIELARRPEWASRYPAIIGASAKLFRVFHILDRVAPSEGTVLICGESGTCKELVAEAIHRNSPRAKGPFVKLNCAALVESLLLSELFGHERGSFTGAHQRKIGRFEMAAGGTLFLDEIGDISPQTQVSLLRVLQEREFERVGGGRPIKVEARIVVATNRNLSLMVRDGTFREDLYYRLKGLTIDLPPLRERPEDVLELSRHFLSQYAVESGAQEKQLSPGATDLLLEYAWPGNIRELENIIRSVALFAESATIDVRDFDEYRELFRDGPAWRERVGGSTGAPLSDPPSSAPSNRRHPAVPQAESNPSGQGWTPQSIHGTGQRVFDDDVDTPGGDPGGTLRAFSGVPTGDREPRTTADLEGALLTQVFAEGVPLPELKRRIQEQAIARALRMTKGNITRAAEVLGMRRPRLSQIINASEELKGLSQGGDR